MGLNREWKSLVKQTLVSSLSWKYGGNVYRDMLCGCAGKINENVMMTSSNGNFSALLAICAGNSPVIGELHEPRIFYPSGHWPETVTNAHVSTHFR